MLCLLLAVAAIHVPDLLDGPAADVMEYKPGLKIYQIKPQGWKSSDKRAAVVWIHGGGWTSGEPQRLLPNARYFALRGAVGFSVQYQLVKPGGPSVTDAIGDVKTALLYIRSHAKQLGVNPKKVAVAGDSAGGHLAMMAGDAADAIIDCNGIPDMSGKWRNRLQPGEDPKKASPLFLIGPKTPPTLILHGWADTVVPVGESKKYYEALLTAKVRAKMITWPESKHAFIVTGYTATNVEVERALYAIDDFLVELGFLHGNDF